MTFVSPAHHNSWIGNVGCDQSFRKVSEDVAMHTLDHLTHARLKSTSWPPPLPPLHQIHGSFGNDQHSRTARKAPFG